MIAIWFLGLLFFNGVLGTLPLKGSGVSYKPTTEETYRLTTDFAPSDYKINLVTQISKIDKDSTFTGDVTINLAMKPGLTKAKVIQLHAQDIAISDGGVTLQTTAGVDIPFTPTQSDPDTDKRNFLTLTLNKDFTEPNAVLSIKYTGNHRTDMYGFYKSYYLDESGNTRWLLATQFEPLSARRAFPCFDEPGYKAKFTLSIESENGYTANSNMPLMNKQSQKDGTTVYNFQQSEKMSSYLVAFLVSDFKSISADKNETFNILARKDAVDNGKYAINTAYAAIQSLNEWTQFQYPLPKMDVIAVPDFAPGAMENWGFVTYRERLLIFVDGISSTLSKQGVTTVICHEFGHQWFGDLVSPDWWKYLWLNEGFATYFELFTASKIETSWRLMDQFVIENHQAALQSDALASTHAMNTDVQTPEEINAVFDDISYAKAGSVIRMMEHFLTTDVFQKGLQKYLQDFQYKNANTDNLFETIDSIVPDKFNKSVTEIMNSWALQKGYPVVKVTRYYDDNNTITLEQERYLLSPAKPKDSSIWFIPITYKNNKDSVINNWLFDKVANIEVDSVAAGDPLIINVDSTAFYRANYDDKNWQLITDALKENFTKINTLNRAALIDDAWNLARADHLDYKIAFNLIDYLPNEDDYIPWSSMFNVLNFLYPRFQSESENKLDEFILKQLEIIYDNLKFEQPAANEDHTTILNRGNVLNWACKVGKKECLESAGNIMAKFMQGDPAYRVHADLKSVVYCYGLKDGKQTTWDYLWETFKNTTISTEQVLILSALGCTSNETILNNYLVESINVDSPIRSQDANLAFSSVYNNPKGVDIALDFLEKHFTDMQTRYGGLGAATKAVSGLAGKVATDNQTNRMLTFLEKHKDLTNYNSAIELIHSNTMWNKHHYEEVDKLANGSGSLIATTITIIMAFIVAKLH